MSTILKALKKVEGKREASVAKIGMPDSAVYPAVKTRRSRLRGLIAAAILLIVVLGGVAGYHIWQSGKSPSISQKPIETVPLSVNNAGQTLENEIIAPNTPSSENLTVELPPPAQDSPQKAPMVKNRTLPPAKKQPAKKLIAKPDKTVTPKPQIISKAPVKPEASAPVAPSIDNRSKRDDIPLLEDRSLDIQALVYSKDSAKRMIVLNGEILRQGYEYKGYTIEAIESKRVLVKKNGKVSALLFGK